MTRDAALKALADLGDELTLAATIARAVDRHGNPAAKARTSARLDTVLGAIEVTVAALRETEEAEADRATEAA